MKTNVRIKFESVALVLITGLLLELIPARSIAQSFCPNSNFSFGNFSNWDGYYGDFDNPEAVHGFVLGSRHTINHTPGNLDQNTCDSLITVPKGEEYTARLGNDDVNGEAEELRYTFSITNDNNLFIYKYAVVLEDPGHDPDQQPSFTLEVRKQDGQLFDPVCGYYYVYAQPGLPGWHFCASRGVVWKDWTYVGLDLSSLVGQTITIVFTTRDCSLLGHFGYAYLTTQCSKLELDVGFCLQNSTVTVTAPPGFSYLWSTGETTRSIEVANPVPGMVESCQLTAVNGCQVTIQAVIQPTFLTGDFTYVAQCAEVPVSFTDKSTINQNTITDWEWDFGDGTPPVSNNPNPTHAYAKEGNYTVKMVVHSSDPCTDTVIKQVTILPKITVDLGKDITVGWNNPVYLDAGNPGASYLWSTGETTQTITTGGEQTIWVVAHNDYCSDSDTIVIHEFARCVVGVPTAFSPNGDGQNDILYIYGGGAESFEFLLYDRSGELVFRTTSTDQGWDGTVNGQPQGMAVYNYVLRGTCLDGHPFFKKGNVTLLR